jgi:MoaA/NifB/PqqE/SkfB family radical SAM enzyme
MFSFEQLRTVQVEITNRCQASCPMCLRNIHGGIENPSLLLTDWDLPKFKNIFTDEVLTQIDSISFCGNFGDPIMNNSLIDMCEYVGKKNANSSIIISTNGSARTTDWWKKLASVLPKNHKVIFAIDGLENTHAIYRIGTSYDMIIKNAMAFIST